MTRARAPGNWGAGRRRKTVHTNNAGRRLLIGALLVKAKQSRHRESWTQPRPFSRGLI